MVYLNISLWVNRIMNVIVQEDTGLNVIVQGIQDMKDIVQKDTESYMFLCSRIQDMKDILQKDTETES